MKPELLIFDVNETLLDLSPLKEKINTLMNHPDAFEHWFSKMIQFTMVETLTNTYSDFGEIGKASFVMLAAKYSKTISEDDIHSTLQLIRKLNPHPEVKPALEKLKSAGFKLVALTNGGLETLDLQMNYSTLGDLLDGHYSVEAVKKFKPHPAPYLNVLEKENVTPNRAMLVAAHAWDVAGAQHIGMQTAFIKRPGKFPYPKGERPTLVCTDFTALCQQLIDNV